MSSHEDSINQRVIDIIQQFTAGKQRRFAEAIGVGSGALGDIVGQRKSKPGFEIISKILRAFPELRAEWLMRGEGDMLKSVESSKKNFVLSGPTEFHIEPDASGNRQVPVINYKAAANYLTGYQSQEWYEELEVLSLPRELLPGKNRYLIFPVTGESMEPTFFTDDLVLCQQSPPERWLDLRGENLAVVVSRSNGLQLKRVTVRKSLRLLRCRSDNPRSIPFDLSLDDEGDKQSDVLQLWIVEWFFSKRIEAPEKESAQRINSIENEVGDLRYLLETMLDEREMRRRLRERDRNKDND